MLPHHQLHALLHRCSWLVYMKELLDKMKRTYLAAACFKRIHSHLLLHTCEIKQKLISDLMPFGLQWGVVPILSFCESNLPVTLWTLLSPLPPPFPPISQFLFILPPSTYLYSFPSSMETHSYLFATLYSSSLSPPSPPRPLPSSGPW